MLEMSVVRIVWVINGTPYKRFLTKGSYTLLLNFDMHIARYYNDLYFIFGNENSYFNGETSSEYYAKVCDGNFIEWGDKGYDSTVELKSSCGFNYLKYDLIEENLTTVPSMNYTTTLSSVSVETDDNCIEPTIEQIDNNEYNFSFGCNDIDFNIKVDAEQDYTYLVFKFETTDSGVTSYYNTSINIHYPRENDILGFYNGYDRVASISPNHLNPDNYNYGMFNSEVIFPIKHKGTNYIYIYGHCGYYNTIHNVKLTITQLTEGNFNYYKMAKYSTENTFVGYIDKDKYELIE